MSYERFARLRRFRHIHWTPDGDLAVECDYWVARRVRISRHEVDEAIMWRRFTIALVAGLGTKSEEEAMRVYKQLLPIAEERRP